MKNFLVNCVLVSLLLPAVQVLGQQNLALQNWGLKNTGVVINTNINPLQSYRLQAVPGEDIRLAPPVKGRKIKVAVLDTGLDLNHKALQAVITHRTGKCEAYKKFKNCLELAKDDNDTKCREEHLQSGENIYPADCHGWSILDQGMPNTPNNIIGRPDFSDPHGHGTHVAGIIASISNNVEIIPVQVSGEGPNQPIKPFSIDLSPNENIRNGYTSSDAFLSERMSRAIIYAINAGAEVINLSIGWPEGQTVDIIKEAIDEAQKRGIIIVAAAGNDSTNALLRPCQYKGVICVAAHAPDGSLASFTNFGFGVDIAAPGVEILSTIPMAIRSIRLPGITGYDLMSGTSQATPFVAGVVADMLSRGIPVSEIYPRLILGARSVKKELPILVGPTGGQTGSKGQAVDASTVYKKTVLSGLLDMTRALQVPAQALILPANKETQVINWDRKSSDLSLTVALKNYWKTVNSKIQITVRPTLNSVLEPVVVAVEPLQNMSSWAQGEEKLFKVRLRIKDQDNASLSRLPSELSYQVNVAIDGKNHRQFEVKAEVLVNINDAITGVDVFHYNLIGDIPRGMKLTLIDEVLDGQQGQQDYFIIGKDDDVVDGSGRVAPGAFNIGLVRNWIRNNQNNYKIEEVQKIEFKGDINLTRPQYKIRIDLDGDGESEYIYGLIEYLDKDDTIYGDYKNHFYIFDNNMKFKKHVEFDDKRAALPIKFFWMKLANGQMRPAWVGKGQEITPTIDITDLWSPDMSPEDTVKNYRTKVDIHFYYLDDNFKLQQLRLEQKDERIVDVIQANQQGMVTVLIAKNLGTEIKPSYINEFSIANVMREKISEQAKMKNFAAGGTGNIEYRNLVDTYADKTLSLSTEAPEFQGMMWYGLDSHQRQRVTLIDIEQRQIYDKMLSSQRAVQDSALLVSAGFQSQNRRGVFLATNSELEYHDLNSGGVVSTSLNRYTFIGDTNYIQLLFPITLIDRQEPSKKLPALFTTEQSGLSRGVRMLVPVYSKDGKVQQMVTPARLRLKSERGCKPLESPVYLGGNLGYAMDYQCENKIIRFLLKY